MLQYNVYRMRTWIGYLRAGDSARPSRRAVKSWEATEMQKQAREPHLTRRLQAMPVPLSVGREPRVVNHVVNASQFCSTL